MPSPLKSPATIAGVWAEAMPPTERTTAHVKTAQVRIRRPRIHQILLVGLPSYLRTETPGMPSQIHGSNPPKQVLFAWLRSRPVVGWNHGRQTVGAISYWRSSMAPLNAIRQTLAAFVSLGVACS